MTGRSEEQPGYNAVENAERDGVAWAFFTGCAFSSSGRGRKMIKQPPLPQMRRLDPPGLMHF